MGSLRVGIHPWTHFGAHRHPEHFQMVQAWIVTPLLLQHQFDSKAKLYTQRKQGVESV